MKLYKAYSLIPTSRLMWGDVGEDDIRIEWVCYMRDDPIRSSRFVKNYDKLMESDEAFDDNLDKDEYLRWVQQRTNNLLREAEVEELRDYLKQKYDLPMYLEGMDPPINVKDLPWFKENHINHMIILHERGDPFTLSTCIIGMVSPFKSLNSVNTVREFLQEIDRQHDR